MTSDAKIGLLLGLVFIFIIAFIINGLPKLRGESENNELTRNQMENTRIGIGLEGSDEVINSPPQANEKVVLTKTPTPQQPQSTFYDSDVRHIQPVPEWSHLSDWSPLRPPAPLGPVGPIDFVWSAEPEKTVTIEPSKPPKPLKPKTYVVTSGDSLGLSSIAKKFYGPIEGNKRANVAKIFEANKNILKSPDDIYVGQKLVIPPLQKKPEAKSLLPESLFEQVEAIGKRTDFTSLPKPKLTSTRFYTVKDGDSLWSISADQLGNGIRYKEIAQLNKDVLPNEDDVRIGLKLKIPAK